MEGIYAGNFSRNLTEDELRQAFESFGQVTSVKIIKDNFSRESRGFGFIEMPNDAESQAAIDGLNGKELKGRNIVVNKTRPRSDNRKDRSGGGRRFGGGRGFGRRSY